MVKFEGMETITRLYNAVTAMQTGDAPDPYGYGKEVCAKAHDPAAPK